jgi:O-methyltransferase
VKNIVLKGNNMAPLKALLERTVMHAARSLGSGKREMGGRSSVPSDLDRKSVELWDQIKSRTMTSVERIDALCRAVEYIHVNSIPGDIVECGVWRGGSTIAAALTLIRLRTTRQLWLYDTFVGMTPPSIEDVDINGHYAGDLLALEDPDTGANWARSSLADVQQGFSETGYPLELVNFVVGPVEHTIPQNVPATIALLRLDTDWFQSTYHELIHLWPRLADGGILIIDDYGHWAGAKKAVDRYFSECGLRPFLHRIDYTGRLVMKCHALSSRQGSVR